MDGSGDRDDAALLRAAATGDAEAFGAFYDRWVDAVTAYFGSRTRDREAAADLTAETFAVALRAVRRYRPEIVNAPAEQQALAAAHVPKALRRGSIVAGIYADDVKDLLVQYHGERAFNVRVQRNVAVFHTRHTAPVGIKAKITLLDADGRAIRP